MARPSTRDILNKYSRKLESSLDTSPNPVPIKSSQEYQRFKQDMIPQITRYEHWAQSLGNLIKLKISQKDKLKIQKQLSVAHLDVTPEQSLTLATVSMLLIFLLTILSTVSILLINGSLQLGFAFLGIIASIFVFYYAYSTPKRLANQWRLQASSQMVPAILYIVVYMKHTSNLERAIGFASQHLQGPLALDLKKIFYDVEIGKFPTIKQSLENYLEFWKDDAPEFIEAFHLIESSLFEPTEQRRVHILEKSLQVILDGVYEKMLKYSRGIRSPLTNIYMLGIILPTLGLALLPLASALLGGSITWPQIMIVFNVLIPFGVFYMTSNILFKRPGGYGETSILELNPGYQKYKSKKAWTKAALVAIPLLILGFLPFLFQIEFLVSALNLKSDYTFGELGIPLLEDTFIFDFKDVEGQLRGPFGLMGVLLSLFIPASVAVFFSSAYKNKTKDLIKARENTKTLEQEFTNSLFILGNRLGENIPAEIAFSRVANTTQGQKTHDFFSRVSQNMQQLGLSLERAIFDKKRGAIIYYPSNLIATSMRILIESSKKGLKVAARSLMAISDYIKNIQKINQRLRDLLAEVVSDMRSNMTFLAPLLAGIVVGLASMITVILNKLSSFDQVGDGSLGGFGSFGNITQLFDVSQMIPPFFLQVIVGIYLIEIAFILTGALVTVNSGKDTLKEKNDLSKNLKRSITLYIITSLIAILALSILASVSLGGLT